MPPPPPTPPLFPYTTLFRSRSALPALQHADLPLAAHAWRAFATPDWPRIGELCVLSSALKTAREARLDRKSTRLNSSHSQISYAVFCLKKKKKLHPVQAPHV